MSKLRSDRNHIVYKLTCAKTKEFYIGVTVIKRKNPEASLETRWKQHLHRTNIEQWDSKLCEAIRKNPNSWSREIVAIIRGKQSAHDLERKLIEQLKPSLNGKKIL